MKEKHNESLSLRLFNNLKDVKMEKENKGVSHTSFEVKREREKKKKKIDFWLKIIETCEFHGILTDC